MFGIFWREGDMRGYFVRGRSRVGGGFLACFLVGIRIVHFHVGRKPGKPNRLVGPQSWLVLGDSGK